MKRCLIRQLPPIALMLLPGFGQLLAAGGVWASADSGGRSTAVGSASRLVEADFQAITGTNTHYESVCVGSGHASLLLRQAALDQLKDVHDHCGFQWVRFHGLLSDDMGVYREENGKPVCNFQYVDMVYDGVLNAGLKPVVELSFMPSALASGSRTVFWWRANVTPPKSLTAWGDLVQALAAHLEKRYGRDQVKTWYFEVWNEPNHPAFYTTKLADYLNLYDVSARAVKRVCADFRIGGPATAGNAWVPELIEHCHSNGIPLDFISTHAYGVHAALDEYGAKILYLIPGNQVISSEVRGVHDQIAQSAMPRLPLLYTEWSASSSDRDPVHDSYVSAPYILNTIKHTAGLAQAFSYWTFSDVFEENGPPPSPFFGGFGLVNLEGLHKPAYFAYEFLHDLGGLELQCDDPSATVCRSGDDVQALIWNYTYPKQDAPDKVYFKRDLPAKPLPPVIFKLKHATAGKYRLEVYGVGYRRNDVYDDYLDLGSPANPTCEQIQTLARTNNGAPLSRTTVKIKAGGEFEHTFPMRENDVYLVTLKKVE